MLLPESVKTKTTTALDATWAARLELLRYELLKVDLLNETNTVKLKMWLEMFGVSLDAIPNNLTTEEYQRLLRYIIIIFRLSGTKRSIELLCYILGVTEVTITQDFTIYYNGMARYNGLYHYDAGELVRPFAVRLMVSGISNNEFENFETKLRRLFEIFEPVWVFLQDIETVGDGFPVTFPFILSGAGSFPLTFPILLGESSRFPATFPMYLQ